MHPAGPAATPCPDWDLVEDDWFLFETACVDGELVLAQAEMLEACDRNVEIMIYPSIMGRCPAAAICLTAVNVLAAMCVAE
jgi:hypothetical protein